MSPTFGTSLLTTGPGDSACIRYRAPSPSLGIRASVSTSTPMPPIHWVSARQNKMPRGRDSISERMVAPVVVKPETVSKKAST